jgi:uncharacterized membrane protein
MKPPLPSFASRMMAKAISAFVIILLLPSMVILGFKLLGKIGIWIFFAGLLIAAARMARAAIQRHRQEW